MEQIYATTKEEMIPSREIETNQKQRVRVSIETKPSDKVSGKNSSSAKRFGNIQASDIVDCLGRDLINILN